MTLNELKQQLEQRINGGKKKSLKNKRNLIKKVKKSLKKGGKKNKSVKKGKSQKKY